MKGAWLLAAAWLLACCSPQSVADEAVAEAVLSAYREAIATGALDIDDMPRAIEVQQHVVQSLQTTLGDIVGYKAALTNAAAQARFGVNGPVLGVLLAGMLRPQGSVFELAQGVDLWLEADLILRIGSESVNQAQTFGEFIAALDAVIPFVEVPDRLAGRDTQLTGAAFTAINAGARYGITGAPVRLGPALDWARLLQGLRVSVTDGEGRVLALGGGEAALGHPLTALRWIRDELLARGLRLQSGDLVSVGTLASPLVPRPGQVYQVIYAGLGAHPQAVVVGFR